MDADEKAELRAVSERLKRAVRAAGGNATVAKAAGVPLSTLNKYLDDNPFDPKFTKIARVAVVCGVSLDHLWSGTVSSPPEGEFTLIPKLDVRASAGPGSLDAYPHDQEREMIAFRTEWLRRIGVQPKKAELLVADNDSMEPTIKHGDIMLVDRGIDRIIDEGIYIVVLAGFVLVKRVQIRRDGTVVLKSDNPNYDSEDVPPAEQAELIISGRVKWVARTF